MSYFKDIDNTKLCEEGDKLYRVGKYGIQEVTMVKVEKASLGHYIYKDNLRNSTFRTSSCKIVF